MEPRFWLCRIYLCLSVILVAAVGMTDPTSRHHWVFDPSMSGGAAAGVFLFWFSILGLVDTIGHDLIGLRTCVFQNIRRFRFLWLMALAIGLTALILVNTQWIVMESTTLRYALDASIAIALAVSDLRTRR